MIVYTDKDGQRLILKANHLSIVGEPSPRVGGPTIAIGIDIPDAWTEAIRSALGAEHAPPGVSIFETSGGGLMDDAPAPEEGR